MSNHSNAIQKLLGEVVDYAGLFPPAGLSMPEITNNYHQYVNGEYRWMLGRLIVPAMKLQEFAEVHASVFADLSGQPTWKISALIPAVDAPEGAFATALKAIADFNSAITFATVDAIEGKLPDVALVDSTCDSIPESLEAFLEIPWQDPADSIQALAASTRENTFGKIRTGGVTENLIPPVEQVANFIYLCANHELGFKATAGLHHPVRGPFPLTYLPNADRGIMHGFMNVFLAAALARAELINQEGLVQLLGETNPAFFSITDDDFAWRDHRISTDLLAQVRDRFAISFGSCSFLEPVEDLIKLGWLADAAKSV